MRGGILSKARRGELITPLPIGLAYDAAGHAGPDPDTSIQQAVTHLFTTFAATGSAHAVVKTFSDARLLFPRRHRKGPRKGELDWAPLAHPAVLRILHNPRYAGVFCFGRHRDRAAGDGTYIRQIKPREEWISFIPGAHPGYITADESGTARPGSPNAPPPTEPTAPKARPAKDPPCSRASSSAAGAETG
jgi:hypothetical protein